MDDTRRCCRPGCSREAVATLTYAYAEQIAFIGPLAPAGNPHSWDLCAVHAERSKPPQGWQLERTDWNRSPHQADVPPIPSGGNTVGITRAVDEPHQHRASRLGHVSGISGVSDDVDSSRSGHPGIAHPGAIYRDTASDMSDDRSDDDEDLDLEIISPLLADAADRQRRRRQWRGRGQEVDPSKVSTSSSSWQRQPFGTLDRAGADAPGDPETQKNDDRGRHAAPPNPGETSEDLTSPRRRRHPALGNLPRQIRRGHLKAVPRPDEET